ncbi:L-lactate dehydrogenase 1 [[Clostridium] ultunense Esp]|uniref:L-lactate dehydrogenase n=1 Tax=Thermicanus aegyptius TaxID=94009 RepID=UPI0002B6F779|nr:L-lactate dehydrogenase [Thermicanus aegyptius]CCQ98623.1 L-lactate dehydrogenase 1 [[Clostridium] ultunense Esp]
MASKIVLIGSGAVGATFAYTVLVKGLATELVIIDQNKDKALGDALDLNHGLMLAYPMKIKAGGYEDCEGADLIVIAAGAAQRPGETRLDLMGRNVAIFRSILGEVTQYTQTAILLIATNPVDLLTLVALKITGWPKNRVLGSGTLLDSSRFRYLVGQKLRIDPRSVHGLIIGEHGDSEVPLWSSLNVVGTPLEDHEENSRFYISPEEKEKIYEETRGAAYEIIAKKGATYYAIALALARITEAILRDQRSILPVSAYLEGEYGVSDICLGVPCVLGNNGIEEIVQVPLSQEEREGFLKSAKTLKEFSHQIGF